MSLMSVKSVLDSEFSQMKSSQDRGKKKPKKLSKVQDVKRVHQRHGLKKQRQKLLQERRALSAPKRSGPTAYWSHAPEPNCEDGGNDEDDKTAKTEENVR